MAMAIGLGCVYVRYELGMYITLHYLLLLCTFIYLSNHQLNKIYGRRHRILMCVRRSVWLGWAFRMDPFDQTTDIY